MEKLTYTTTYDLAVEFYCPECLYENKNYGYREALIYTKELEGICASCKTKYTLVKKINKNEMGA
ncbi:hypothetical protein [Streptococcus pluranimalium]|uniref:hypothetical protein n=1 Tax=Streptococcus pluranimalium TaxID=82348 RepID=UPI0039FD7F0F